MNKFLITIFMLVVTFFLVQWQCNEFRKNLNTDKASNKTKIDTLKSVRLHYDSTVYKPSGLPNPIKVHDTIFIPTKIDTIAFLLQFLTQSVYVDSFKDKNIEIQIKDTVFKNKIVGRGVLYKILRPDSTITLTVKKITPAPANNKIAVSAGAFLLYPNNLVMPSIGIHYSNWNFGLGTNLNNYQFNLTYNIWKR